MLRSYNRFLPLIGVLVVVLIMLSLLYMLGMEHLEGKTRNFWQALPWAAGITSTTGYSVDTSWQHPVMVLFVVFAQFLGVTMIFLVLPMFLIPLLEERFETKLPQESANARDHVLIFDYGPAVATLITELEQADIPTVIIDEDEAEARHLLLQGHRVIHGNLDEGVLTKSNLGQARALIVNGGDDRNAATILAARQSGFKGEILALVEDPYHRQPMILAGASGAFTPRHVLGAELAARASQKVSPTVAGIAHLGHKLQVVEVRIARDSALGGPASVVLRAAQLFVHLYQCGGIFARQSHVAGDLVDLLRHRRQQHRDAELLGKCGLEFLVLVRNVHPAAGREIARDHARHAHFERDAVARAHLDGVMDHLRVESGAGAEHHCLSHGDRIDLHQHVVDQLQRHAAADFAGGEQMIAHGLKGVLEGRLRGSIATNENSQGAGAGALDTAADRGVDEAHPRTCKFVMQGADFGRCYRAHAGDVMACVRRFHHARGTGHHSAYLNGRIDHAKNAAGGARHRGRRRRDFGAKVRQSAALLAVDVMDHQRNTGGDQPLRHRIAHCTDSDESCLDRHVVSACVLTPTQVRAASHYGCACGPASIDRCRRTVERLRCCRICIILMGASRQRNWGGVRIAPATRCSQRRRG